MTNIEEVLALIIFVPCVFCIVAGVCSMASQKCNSCCCVDGGRDRRSFWLHPQQLWRSNSRDNQQSYRRLTRGSSTIMNLSFEEDGGQVVTEFDFRQSLHMECGVLALEPPPSYTASLIKHGRTKGRTVSESAINSGTQYTLQDEPEEEDRRHGQEESCFKHQEGTKGSPPPYPEETTKHAIHMDSMTTVRYNSKSSQESVSSV